MACDSERFLHGIDEVTADLIIQLQLDDANFYSSSSKGKGREDEPSDESIAFQLQKQELERISLFLSDKRMSRSIADAVQTDGQMLREATLQEAIVARDIDLARQLNDGTELSNSENSDLQLEPQLLDDELLAKLQILYVSDLSDLGEEQAESSASAAHRTINPSSLTRHCEACREEKKFFEVARTPCRHEYCRACLEDLFETAMRDESLFPPRCCRQPILMASVRMFLPSELVRVFEKKKVEFETPNRTYCCLRTCSAFITTQNISDEVATCLECGTMTCTICKEAAHEGECPNNTALQQVLDTARENGWQRCYSCRRLVELDHGCNHMTCLCGAGFCYLCGQQWKTCACEQWDEHRLLARANQIIDREAAPLANLPAPLGERRPLAGTIQQVEEAQHPDNAAQAAINILVARAIQNLRENHECDHEQWRWVRGPHQCEECSHLLPQYIFECHQCRLQACNRCRRHRL